MKRSIKKVAVLGSGVMGSRIACHFANIGVEVVLLDIVPRELNEAETQKGLSLETPQVRNRIVNDALKTAIASNPSPLYKKSMASLIHTGNMDDDMALLADCDWIIEAVIERLDIKQQVFEKVEQHRKAGTLISSNTSGIPIGLMLKGRSDDFRKHFCGTHFFNPPRYLRLLEIIPGPETDQAVIDFMMHYGDLYLGKKTVLCKDTPAFIANRIGVFAIMTTFHLVEEMGLSIEAVDKLTGPVIGRPKSATFRTCDVVGLDTLVHVANGLHQALEKDESREQFQLPDYISKMVENKWLGSKTKQGFYKKVKNAEGKSDILSLDLSKMDYREKERPKFAVLETTKTIDELRERLKVLIKDKEQAGAFYRKSFYSLFQYVSHRIPEISNDIYRIDDAVKAGFGWDLGPFELWDALDVQETMKHMEAEGFKPAPWVQDMLDAGRTSFYTYENGVQSCYDIPGKKSLPVPGLESFIILEHLAAGKTVWKNAESRVIDLGDGILNFEFRSKMNTLGGGVIQGLQKAIDLAEKDYKGLVIGNQAPNFSVGANLMMIFMMAAEQDYDELNMAVRAFQNAIMRVRYSSIPVVVAPHGMSFGGACEMTLHADAVQAAAETYIGLVEFGVGLIPGGGGTKELTLQASDHYSEGDIELNILREKFLNIGMAKVATSASEAYDLGYLRKGRDAFSMNIERQLADAKARVLRMADDYKQPVQRKDIRVLGKQALGMFNVGAYLMQAGHYISEHDRKISEKLAWVMAGGDLSEPAQVSEQYLLDLEREAFLSLCGEAKTLERIQHMLKTGKPLRN